MLNQAFTEAHSSIMSRRRDHQRRNMLLFCIKDVGSCKERRQLQGPNHSILFSLMLVLATSNLPSAWASQKGSCLLLAW